MVAPIIIAAALAAAAHAGTTAYSSHRNKKSKTKESKLRAQESKRETFADMLDQANTRRAELSGMRLSNSLAASKRRANAMQSTAKNFREALLNV